MTSDINSASTTLDAIINELKLTYDNSVGLLDGDNVRTIPNIKILLNLSKLFSGLKKELDAVEVTDDSILTRIKQILNKGDHTEDAEEEQQEEGATEENDEEENNGSGNGNGNDKKRGVEEISVEEDDEEEDGDETALNKKRKVITTTDDKDEEESKENLNTKDDPVPPVQSGSFTHENDTRLKNPKSEFVTSQTLPAEAIAELGLWSEDNHGLETHGKEYLKRKYGVASYPENDLQSLLPGPIPNIDFSKTKAPSNQVQFTTYQSYIESYFRPFSNEDIEFLNERYNIQPGMEKTDYDPEVTPFLIPKLGRFYADVWADEDATLSSKLNSPAYQQAPIDSYKAKGTVDNLNDDTLYTEDISCGPLSSRLLSAILSTREASGDEDGEDNGDGRNGSLSNGNDDESNNNNDEENHDISIATQLDSGEDYKLTGDINDFSTIEDRLRRELKYIGIFMNLPVSEDETKLSIRQNVIGGRIKKSSSSIIDNDDWIKNKEDDEVCAEMRQLQRELREVVSRNKANRKKLIPIVEEQIAYQEYCAILEDLDKQVDQAYMKRLKGKSKKKKIDTSTPQQQAANNGLRTLLEKRRRWIDNIGKLFKPGEIMKRVPSESILIREGTVEQEINDDDNADNVSSAVDIIEK
ncbi:histone acetyltransferase transcription factor [Scheffersomyces amazonensis]|uniref:histone acetyltransferase transcription factor n=1 Tax=Scheffersomyces amazonensis TaxID=1078765 RepID=UPI00315DDF65